MLSHVDLRRLPPEHFEYVVIDEFHHAAAKTYDRLLHHLKPKDLLGLTGTPERADDLPILQWFDDRIAAELRLWDAIDQHYLVPFQYYGIHDGMDLSQVPWRRGRGYDVEGLSNLYTQSDLWARQVIDQVDKYSDDLGSMRALGFCVSIEHARYMARCFNEASIPSVAVTGEDSTQFREAALDGLQDGRINAVFSVDLFNEGVDLPSLDTLLLLRPTDSPTLFLQQLGRGLRTSDHKEFCTVLDFVGQHRREFRFHRRFQAIFGATRKEIEQHVVNGFPFLPAGCHMELDRKASEIVLENIKNAVPRLRSQKVAELRRMAVDDRSIQLATYLDRTGTDLEDLYSARYGWSDLREAAELPTATAGPEEKSLRRAISRLLHIDDQQRLKFYLEILSVDSPPNIDDFDELRRRLWRMLLASLIPGISAKQLTLQQGIELLWGHPQVRAELSELFEVLVTRIDHLHHPLSPESIIPLQLHAQYTRIELLSAFGDGDRSLVRVPPWREGVRWLPEEKADLFAFTLDKTEGNFSPTTRYKDYAITPERIHWESQSLTRAHSKTGIRYQNHVEQGSEVMLFARLKQTDRAFWFLGPATYIRHTGECPMEIDWQLKYPLPGDLYAQFAAVVG
jgi:superfamily II DNA or RNA helicase